MAELPIYKPSGAGATADSMNMFKSKAISWGGYKGGLGRRLEDLAEIKIVNDVEVYDYIDITSALNGTDTETYELLDYLGFSEEDLQRLSDTATDGDNNIEKVILDYKSNTSYAEDSFEFLLNAALDTTQNFDFMQIRVRNYAYETLANGYDIIGPRGFGLGYDTESDDLWRNEYCGDPDALPTRCEEDPVLLYIEDEVGSNPPKPIRSILNPETLFNSYEILLYRNGIDVSDEFNESLKFFLAFLAITESSMISEGNTNTIIQNIDMSDYLQEYIDEGTYTNVIWNEIITSSDYYFDNLQREELADESRYQYYAQSCNETNTCNEGMTDEEKDAKNPTLFFPSYLWWSSEILVEQDIEEATNGLFTMEKGEPVIIIIGGIATESYPNSSVYMTVEGMKKSTDGDFGYWVSTFMNISFEIDEGSFLSRFIGGLIKAFLSFIDAVVGIFLKIPILKQATEIIMSVIGTIFGVDATTARAILGQLIMAVIIMFIAPYITAGFNTVFSSTSTMLGTITTGTAEVVSTGMSVGMSPAISTLITYSSNALTLFEAGMRGKAVGEAKRYAMESANRTYRNMKAQEEAAKSTGVIGGTMGGSNIYAQMNNGMYNIMFNPFYFHPQAIPATELENGYLF